jgi:hypothetical protein
MTHAYGFCRVLLFGLGMSLALGGVARSNDPAQASRESIIQGVRDDVRRKIHEQSASETRKEPGTVGQVSSPSSRQRTGKERKPSME